MATLAINRLTAQDHFDRAREYQEKYDAVLRQIGRRAPLSVLGETLNDYRRRVLGDMQQMCIPPEGHELFKLDVSKLRNDSYGRVLDNFEDQLPKACPEECTNPKNVARGEIRMVEKLDDFGNVHMRDFIGQESFVKQMNTPGRRVKSFSQPLQTIARCRGNERMREVRSV